MEDLFNLVILWIWKMDLNVIEMYDFYRYYFLWYLNLKGGIVIFELFFIREWFLLFWEMDFILNYSYCIKEEKKLIEVEDVEW